MVTKIVALFITFTSLSYGMEKTKHTLPRCLNYTKERGERMDKCRGILLHAYEHNIQALERALQKKDNEQLTSILHGKSFIEVVQKGSFEQHRALEILASRSVDTQRLFNDVFDNRGSYAYQSKSLQAQLMTAVGKGDASAVKEILMHTVSVDESCHYGDSWVTPLMLAAQKGHESVVDLLLMAGAESTIKSLDGDTALTCAAKAGHKRIVAKLSQLHSPYAYDMTSTVEEALKRAVYKGQIEHVRNLMSFDVRAEKALTSAVVQGNKDIALLLVDHVPLHNRKEALMYAAEKGNADLAAVLARTSQERNSVLTVGIFCGHIPLVAMMLQLGADLHAQSEPLVVRVLRDQMCILKYTPRSVSKEKENFLLDLPTEDENLLRERVEKSEAKKNMIQFLIKRGISCDTPDEDGKTPLMIAIEAEWKELVDILIEHGASIDSEDQRGETPVSLALRVGNRAIMHRVLGKDLTQQRHRNTEFLKYSSANKAHIVKHLVRLGVDINGKGRSGKTALMYAVKHKNKPFVEFLLSAGAHIDMFDKDGKSALSYAAALDALDIATLLLDKEAGIVGREDIMDIELYNTFTKLKREKRYKDLCLLLKLLQRDDVQAYLENTRQYCQMHLQRDFTSSCNELHQTLLIWACIFKNTYIVNCILEQAPSLEYITTRDIYGYTALMYAQTYERPEIVQILDAYYQKLPSGTRLLLSLKETWSTLFGNQQKS